MSEPDFFTPALRAGFKPNPYRKPVDFLEHYVRRIPYSIGTPAFTIASSPWLRAPLDAVFDPEVREVAVQAAVQLGKSLIIEGSSCIIPVVDPGPTLILQDVDKNAKDYVDTRLRPLWTSVEPTKAALTSEGVPKDGVINFRSNPCWVVGAGSDTNLHGRTIRYVFGDETWRWHPGAMVRATRRVSANKWRSKVVFVSQAGVEGSEWASWWENSTMEVWTFACPECGHRQPYDWEQVKFPSEAKTPNGWDKKQVVKGTTYECKGCKVRFSDAVSTRTQFNLTGEYVATNPNAIRRGFHWNALCAQERGLSWGELAVECIDAAKKHAQDGDNSLRRDFIMQRLAQTYREEADEVQLSASAGEYKMGDAWEDEGGFVTIQRAGREASVPRAGSALTDEMRKHPGFVRLRFMGVDVQKDGFYWVVRSFSGDGRSRLFGCGFAFSFADLNEIARRSEVHPSNVFLDSGYEPDRVLAGCSTYGWTATRGDQRNEFPWKVQTPMGTKVEMRAYEVPTIEAVSGTTKKVKRFKFSNLRLKDILANLIGKGRHSRASDAPDNYVAQMQSEKRVVKDGGKPIWEQIADRPNHFWDCEVIITLPAIAWKLTREEAKPAEAEAPAESA